ncbi:MAG: hypothetical protein UY75_C0002G0031 [Parcubacteria group bacterium GW2011_GWC2_52_8c]|nr:MAG: hypothetical protein UY64_C0003G0031 [Parcubacteria group bacterium GW2011_GWA1_51_12]KKW31718.1 MAG: hypothetical protein UY75_C0002G0031 [Parcubacteria group bacterium GW2011_GWC2_52_8c]
MPTENPTPEEMQALRDRLLRNQSIAAEFRDIAVQDNTLRFFHKSGKSVVREIKSVGDMILFEYPLDKKNVARVQIPRSRLL